MIQTKVDLIFTTNSILDKDAYFYTALHTLSDSMCTFFHFEIKLLEIWDTFTRVFVAFIHKPSSVYPRTRTDLGWN